MIEITKELVQQIQRVEPQVLTAFLSKFAKLAKDPALARSAPTGGDEGTQHLVKVGKEHVLIVKPTATGVARLERLVKVEEHLARPPSANGEPSHEDGPRARITNGPPAAPARDEATPAAVPEPLEAPPVAGQPLPEQLVEQLAANFLLGQPAVAAPSRDQLADVLRAVEGLAAQVRELADREPQPTPAPELAKLFNEMANLRQQLAERDASLQRLHAKIDAFAQQGIEHVRRGALTELVAVHDELDAELQRRPSADAANLLAFLRDRVLNALEREGLSRAPTPPGARFTPQEQNCVATVVTTDPGEDGQIASWQRPAFRWADGSVFRPAQVVVKRYKPAAGTAGG